MTETVKKRWRVETCAPVEAEDLIVAFEKAGYELKHMAATERGGNGSVTRLVLMFKLTSQPQQGPKR